MTIEVQIGGSQGVVEYAWKCIRICSTLAEAEVRAIAQIRGQERMPHAARRSVRIVVIP